MALLEMRLLISQQMKDTPSAQYSATVLTVLYLLTREECFSELRVVSPTTSRSTLRNAGLLDGVKIGSPTRTRVTPGNTTSVGDTIVG